MNKKMSKNIRTSIVLPEKLHKRIETLALKMGVPLATLVSIFIVDTIDCLEFLDISSNDKSIDENDGRKINLSFDNGFYNNVILRKINEYLPNCSFKDFAIDCIFYQLRKFDYIESVICPNFSNELRIYNSSIALKTEHNYFSSASKPRAIVDDYIQLKSRQYGIPIESLEMFYATKTVNEILSTRPDEREIYEEQMYVKHL